MGFGIGRALGAISKGVLTGKRDAQDRRMADEWRAYQLQQQLGERAQAQANWQYEQDQQNARDAATNERWNLTRLDAQAADRRTRLGNAAKMAMGQEDEYLTPDELAALGLSPGAKIRRNIAPYAIKDQASDAKVVAAQTEADRQQALAGSVLSPVTDYAARPNLTQPVSMLDSPLGTMSAHDALSTTSARPVLSLPSTGDMQPFQRPKTDEEQSVALNAAVLQGLDKDRVAGLVKINPPEKPSDVRYELVDVKMPDGSTRTMTRMDADKLMADVAVKQTRPALAETVDAVNMSRAGNLDANTTLTAGAKTDLAKAQAKQAEANAILATTRASLAPVIEANRMAIAERQIAAAKERALIRGGGSGSTLNAEMKVWSRQVDISQADVKSIHTRLQALDKQANGDVTPEQASALQAKIAAMKTELFNAEGRRDALLASPPIGDPSKPTKTPDAATPAPKRTPIYTPPARGAWQPIAGWDVQKEFDGALRLFGKMHGKGAEFVSDIRDFIKWDRERVQSDEELAQHVKERMRKKYGLKVR